MQIDLRNGLDRALEQLNRFEGEVHIHDEKQTHHLLMRQGRVVAVRVAGHFDPLLARLRKHGALSERAYLSALEDLARSERRSGEVATRRGAPTQSVRRALEDQLDQALRVLRRRLSANCTSTLQPRTVSASEVVAWRTPTATRQTRQIHQTQARHTQARHTQARHTQARHTQARHTQARHTQARHRGRPRQGRQPMHRQALRQLALELHPDRLMHLPPKERRRREERLAQINAVLQGL